MEIQLYKALIGAGVKEDAAAAVVDSLENEIKDRISGMRKELATKDDAHRIEKEIAILKWMNGIIMGGIVALILKTFFQ